MPHHKWSSVLDEDNLDMSIEGDDVEIPVWVGGIEKWVTGLNKRTTCDDVIYALLCHDGTSQGFVDVPSYVICEQWKGVERQLNGRTKIAKLWRTWGSDVRNVRLLLRKTDYATSTYVSGDATSHYRKSRYAPNPHRQDYRHARAGQQDANRDWGVQQQRGRTQSKETVRRRSKSVEPRSGSHQQPIDGFPAHHELEHVNQTALEAPDSRALQQLMTLLADQERRLGEQQGRLKEIDVQIENYESKMHHLRIQKNGQNYVQEAYLRDRGEESSSSGGEESYVSAKAREMENYLGMCESLLQVESRLTAEQCKIDDLSLLLCEQSVTELGPHNQMPSEAKTSQIQSRDTFTGREKSLQDEIDQTKTDLHKSYSRGMAQQMEILAVSQSLGEFELQLQEKTVLLNSLLLQAERSNLFVDSEEGSDSGLPEEDSPISEDLQTDAFGAKKICSNSDITLRNNTNQTNSVETVSDALSRKPEIPACNMDSSSLKDLQGRSRIESQTSDWDWEAEFPTALQKSLAARNMVPYRTYATYEDSASLGLGLANSLKHTALDDSNSDTGLSSLHSDEAPPVLETLV